MTTTRADRRRILSNHRKTLKDVAELFTRQMGFGISTLDFINNPDDRTFISEVILPLCHAKGNEQRKLLDEYTEEKRDRMKRLIQGIKTNAEKGSPVWEKIEMIIEDRAKQA